MPNNLEGDFCFGDDQCARGLKCWCGTCQNIDNPTRANIACEAKGFDYDYVHQVCTTTPSTIDCRTGMTEVSQSGSQSNTQSKTPWGWIIGGTLGVLAVGGGVWWYLAGKDSSSGMLASEPAPSKRPSKQQMSRYKKTKFVVGDKVRFKDGMIGYIEFVTKYHGLKGDRIYRVSIPEYNNSNMNVVESELEKVDDTLDEPTPSYTKPKFKEGDKIKIVSDIAKDYGRFLGEIGTIIFVGAKHKNKGRRYIVTFNTFDTTNEIYVFEKDMKKVR